MKAVLRDLNALGFDRLHLRMLPDGVLDVEIRLYTDLEAYQHLVAYFKAQGYSKQPDANPDRLPVLKLSDGSL